MNPNIQQKIDELLEVVRKESPKNAVSFRLFANYFESEVSFDYFTNKSTSTMKNLKGEWVK